jgi:hypothetical protein
MKNCVASKPYGSTSTTVKGKQLENPAAGSRTVFQKIKKSDTP